MVEFKAGRADIFHSTIPVNTDDWVIVEADRGRDLGKVVAIDLPLHQVEWLLSSSSPTTLDTPPFLDRPPSPSVSSSSSSSASSANGISPVPLTPSSPSAAAPSKRICRLATPSEITLLVTKRQDEQKALLICQSKSKQKSLPMDIVDAEYQWDRRKLTFYFIAERRVDFRELVRDLFKIYKTRIWM
ncbi:PSP1-domain-containing protein [Hesseltinella vesiculosa]|uniref:PSP1-domain-containing protein n=1 Tax=Hesseltinella vesiculosa TaxID=101127 RepID=A0A1X2GQR3_9FUNG|nr:PSP1-domain-containing protein [Hesseltinella vesiculosa]